MIREPKPKVILEGTTHGNLMKALKYLNSILTARQKEVFLELLHEGSTGRHEERKAFYEHLERQI